jgi:hypothetical protein
LFNVPSFSRIATGTDAYQFLPNSSGSLAIFTAIRRALFYCGRYGTDRNHNHNEKNDLRDDTQERLFYPFGCVSPPMEGLQRCQRFMWKSSVSELKHIRQNRCQRAASYQGDAPSRCEKENCKRHAEGRIRTDCDCVSQ